MASGGFISYVEAPNVRQNLDALEAVWDYSYDKVGYFGTNTPIDKCYCCGFEGEMTATDDGFECPNCKNNNIKEMNVVKRLCGYLGEITVRGVVHGRREEIIHRVKHEFTEWDK